MGCTSGLMKCGLNIINSIYAIFAIALIVLGCFLVDTAPQSYVIYVFVVASIIFITSMLGCCGICKEHVCMTTAYACILLASLVFQIVGRYYTLDSEAIRKFASDEVERTWLEEIRSPGAMNKTQQTFHCCGKIGPNDYYGINRQSFPLSCYPNQKYNVTALFHTGCIVAAQDNFTYFFNYASAASWGSIAFCAVLVLCAFYLVARFRKRQERYNY